MFENALKSPLCMLVFIALLPFTFHTPIARTSRNARFSRFALLTLLTLSTVFESHKLVSFKVASKVSYVYNLSAQLLIKNAKRRSILASFRKSEASSQTGLPDGSVLIG